MSINTESLASVNNAATDFLLSAANTALGSAERITSLNIDTARSVLEDSASNTKALMGAKDLQEAISIQASLAKPNAEKAAAYSSSVYAISTETQQAFAQMLEAQFGDFQKTVSGLLDKAMKSAPAGSEAAIDALRSTLTATSTAFGNMNTAAKQLAETAQSNIVAATNAAVKGAEKKLPKASV